MNRQHNGKPVPLSLWIVSFAALLVLIGTADLLYRNLPPTTAEKKHLRKCFQAERLAGLKQPGVVVLGSSLVRYGFPFDEDMEKIARNQGQKIHFIRFSRRGGSARDFSVLLDAILQARPRWVFIQAEPLVLKLRSNRLPNRIIQAARRRIRFLKHLVGLELAQVFGHDSACHTPPQDDSRLKLEKIATLQNIRNNQLKKYSIKVPVLPDFVRFIAEAEKLDIHVVLLEMNRSRKGNESFGPDFRKDLDKALQELADYLKVPLWRFRGDLSLQYYKDRGHLNRHGRQLFTNWFLSLLAAEQIND